MYKVALNTDTLNTSDRVFHGGFWFLVFVCLTGLGIRDWKLDMRIGKLEKGNWKLEKGKRKGENGKDDYWNTEWLVIMQWFH